MGDLELEMAEKSGLKCNMCGGPATSGVEMSGKRPLSAEVWAWRAGGSGQGL